MSYLLNNQQKVNDIIFANRNKSYGAYAIRSTYGNTVFKSLAYMLLGFGAIMSVAFYYSNRADDKTKELIIQTLPDEKIYSVPVNIEPKKENQPKPVEPSSSKASGGTASIGTHVVDSMSQETSTVINTEITSGSTTGTSTVQGPENKGDSRTGTTSVTSSNTNSNTIHVIADKEPEFEGGLKALYAFLAAHLKYPEEARDHGKGGTVYVKFVVDQNGKVGNLLLQNNIGYGLDEEALRVVAMIPNFKTPGIVDGQPVKVYYQVPIKFNMR